MPALVLQRGSRDQRGRCAEGLTSKEPRAQKEDPPDRNPRGGQ